MKSEKVTDIFGNEKVVHYDDYGNKVGESQVEKGFLGLGNERALELSFRQDVQNKHQSVQSQDKTLHCL